MIPSPVILTPPHSLTFIIFGNILHHMETCRFFDPNAAQCKWQSEVRKFLAPHEERLRVRFSRFEDVDDQILKINSIPNKVPSKGTFDSQHALSEGYLRCTASMKDGDEYKPNPDKQSECDGYVPLGVNPSQARSIQEGLPELGRGD